MLINISSVTCDPVTRHVHNHVIINVIQDASQRYTPYIVPPAVIDVCCNNKVNHN